MITKIDITNFGLFNNYSWNSAIGKEETFRRLNIIYGRNYSGKTTLARIFKCIEDALVHKHYPDCGFSLTVDDGKIISHSNFNTDLKIRVYNSDFIRENLSWLYNDDGTIKPFTILGVKNIELDRQIKEIDETLGSEEVKTGLIYKLSEIQKAFHANKLKYQNRNNALEEKLRKRANDKIKVDSNLFLPTSSKKTYTITDIRSDIASIESEASKYLLDVEQKSEKLKFAFRGFHG